METRIEKDFAVDVIYNGIERKVRVETHEPVSALLRKAIAEFGVTQNQHLLSLFREDGTVVDENQTIESAHLRPGQFLLLRPNAVKGGVELLKVADGLLPATFRIFRDCGRNECECAAYWTGPSHDAVVDGVEHPVHTRSPFGYEVQSEWLTEFWVRLAQNRRSVKAQIHTHPGVAYHSRSDDLWPIVSQEGFLSVVIPNFASGEPSLDGAWIGVQGSSGKWTPTTIPSDVLVLS